MDDQEQIAFELPDEPLAETAQRDDLLAVGLIDWRIEGANEERTGEADALEPLTGDARSQRMQVELDVGELRQLIY